jgi:hypothetical protein
MALSSVVPDAQKLSRCIEIRPSIGSAWHDIVNPTRVESSGNIHLIISTIRGSRREFTFDSLLHGCITANKWIISLLFTVWQFEHAMIDGQISVRGNNGTCLRDAAASIRSR